MSTPAHTISDRCCDPAAGYLIPILDLAGYLGNEPGALPRLAADLQHALQCPYPHASAGRSEAVNIPTTAGYPLDHVRLKE